MYWESIAKGKNTAKNLLASFEKTKKHDCLIKAIRILSNCKPFVESHFRFF